MKNLKIKTGLMVVLAIFICILLISTLTGWRSALLSHDAISRLYYIGVEAGTDLQVASARMVRARLALAGSFLEMQAGERDMAAASLTRTSSWLDEANQRFDEFLVLSSDAVWSTQVAELQGLFGQYQQAVQQQIRALQQENLNAYVQANLQAREATSAFDQAVQRFEQRLYSRVEQIMADAAQRYWLARLEALLFIAAGLLISAGFWWFIRQRLLLPLQQAGAHFLSLIHI